jgi:hypothetical protein
MKLPFIIMIWTVKTKRLSSSHQEGTPGSIVRLGDPYNEGIML